MKKWLMLLLLLPIFFWGETFSWDRGDEGKVLGYFDRPEKGSYPVLFLLQGSQKETVLRLHNELKEDLLKIGVALLSFEAQDSFEGRIEAAREFLKRGGGSWPGFNGGWILLGQSDGGRIAAAVASYAPRLLGMILISPGGGWKPEEELLYQLSQELVSQNALPRYARSFLSHAKEQIVEIKNYPKAELQSFGFSHSYWASLFRIDLLSLLHTIDCPLYYVHPEGNDRVPLPSVKALEKSLLGKEKISFHILEGEGREAIRTKKIYLDSFNWMKKSILGDNKKETTQNKDE